MPPKTSTLARGPAANCAKAAARSLSRIGCFWHALVQRQIQTISLSGRRAAIHKEGPGPNTRPAPKWRSASSPSLALGMVRLELVVLQEAFNVLQSGRYQGFFVRDLVG